MQDGRRIETVPEHVTAECIFYDAEHLAFCGSNRVPNECVYGGGKKEVCGHKYTVSASTKAEHGHLCLIKRMNVQEKRVGAYKESVLIYSIVIHVSSFEKICRIITDAVVGLARKTPIVVYCVRIIAIRIGKPRIGSGRRVFPFGT